MVVSGICKHRHTQLEIQRHIWQVLTCHYTKASGTLIYLINYKNDSAVLATALEKPNRLSIDNYIFWGEQRRLLPDPAK